MIIYIITFSFVLFLIFIFYRKNKTKFLLQIEKSKTYFPQIISFYNDFNSLTANYIYKADEIKFTTKWEFLYNEIQSISFSYKIPNYLEIKNFLSFYTNLKSKIQTQNEIFFQNELVKNNELLSNIDGKSLDLQQRKVVLCDEDRTLVLAGAGSGKTLTIAAKVKYLFDVKKVNPKDILLISFTNKSAEEMTNRIQKNLNIPITATTFHKLGLDILKQSLGYFPEIFDNLIPFVNNFFENDLLNNEKLVQNLTDYFTYYLEIPDDLDNFSSLGEYYENEKSLDLETLKSKYDKEQYIKNAKTENAKNLTTLNGEKVKSLEEIKIANFLFMHGINYEYEKLYPFESENKEYKSYRPDFYLTDYDIYLEHFGITKEYKCPWLSAVEEQKYIDGIIWKRDFHLKNKTKLIETYSYYTKEGILLSKLEKLLIENGVKFIEHDFKDIFETVYATKSNKYFSEFIKLCCSFITLFKQNNFEEEDFEKMINKSSSTEKEFIHKRTTLFLDIVKTIYCEYQNYLKENKAIDFSDMINDASKKVEEGCIVHNYKYVIVDEYQDISFSRFNLLKAIVNSSTAKLLCVGDDWQSIYRFAGSDVSLFTEFEKYFGYTQVLKIEKTYRNSQQLINEASNFVTKNPLQLKKDLKSDKNLNYPLVFWGYDKDLTNTLSQIINKIIFDFGNQKSILILGRTSFDFEILQKSGLFNFSKINRELKITYLKNPEIPIYFLTVHKSKGLEADNVILLNFKNDKLGFPNQIADDKVLNYVLTQNEDYIFAEERRLFYVAITRTKNRTFVLTDNKNPSIFLHEFSQSSSCCFININQKSNDISKTKCPRCKSGDLLQINHNGNIFIGCSNFPRCQYTNNNTSILVNPKQCPNCGGFLVKRKGKNNHYFVGCTNYPYCTYTQKINSN